MAELKPCPFCGYKDILKYTTKRLHQMPIYTIKCMTCMAEISRSKPQKATDMWNNRAESEELKFTRQFIHEHGLDFALASAWKGRAEDGK